MTHSRTAVCVLVLLVSGMLSAQAPNFRWAKGSGGTSADFATGIAVDASGNSYVAGYFLSPTITFGATTLTNASNGYDGYLVKYDAGGSAVWAARIGGTDNDIASAVAVDVFGNICVTGYFISSTVNLGSATLMNIGGTDFYIAKYDPNGNVLWAKSAGGSLNDKGNGIAVDVSGNSYVTGFFNSATIGFGVTTLTNVGNSDQFVVKYDADGDVVWARSAGGSSEDIGNAIAADASGNCYVTGSFFSPTMTFTGATTLTSGGSYDMYVAKYNAIGTVLWARSGGGGALDDYGNGIAVDASGNSYVTGQFGSTSLTFGATTLTRGGGYDIYAVKYDASGNAVWAKSAGGPGDDYGNGIAIDTSGNSYVTGMIGGATFTFGSTILTNAGLFDSFVAKYNAGGSAVWARGVGGSNEDDAFGVAVDGSGNAYLAGRYYSATMGVGATTLTNAGTFDMWVAKLSTPPMITSITDVPGDQGGEVRIKWNGTSEDEGTVPAQVTSYSIFRKQASGTGMASKAGLLRAGMAMDSSLLGYDYVSSVSAFQLPRYQTVVPTLEDSALAGVHRFTFLVVANNSARNDYTVSLPDSGYSVDNLSPIPPAGLVATVQPGPQVELHWNSPADPDVRSYDVYRSAASGFAPSPATSIGTSATTHFIDAGPAGGTVLYYRIVAVDVHDNRSSPSGAVPAALTGTLQFSVLDKWNMVSIPLRVADYAKSALFPTASSGAFAYENGYAGYAVLENGRGYWVKFSAAQAVSMTGLGRTTDTVAVAEGWNMIGALSVSIAVGSIGSIPGGLTTGSFFGYENAYQVSATMEPGKAYWVKASQAGQLVLASGGTIAPGNRIRILETGEKPPSAPPDAPAPSDEGLPTTHALSQNYPNPFNPATVIDFSVPAPEYVTLKVYNMLGQEVAVLVDGVEGAGYKSVALDASGLPSGVYTYRISAGGFTEVKKMVILK